jgi:hypothetical protein
VAARSGSTAWTTNAMTGTRNNARVYHPRAITWLIMPRQCSHRKPDGTRCRAHALHGSRSCFFHDLATRAGHRAATVAGGRERSRPAATLAPDAPDLALKSVANVVVALGLTVNQVRTGRLGVNVGNCLGQLLQVLLKAIEGGDLEARIAALERGRRGDAMSHGLRGRLDRLEKSDPADAPTPTPVPDLLAYARVALGIATDEDRARVEATLPRSFKLARAEMAREPAVERARREALEEWARWAVTPTPDAGRDAG